MKLLSLYSRSEEIGRSTEDSESRRPTVGEEQYRREKWGIRMNAVLLELVVAMRLFLRQIWRKNDRWLSG